ncbi:unnamed protein product [Lampetra fluviatilis]
MERRTSQPNNHNRHHDGGTTRRKRVAGAERGGEECVKGRCQPRAQRPKSRRWAERGPHRCIVADFSSASLADFGAFEEFQARPPCAARWERLVGSPTALESS